VKNESDQSTGYVDEWEIRRLICPKGHTIKLSILKDAQYRNTWCSGCGIAVLWERDEKHNKME